MLANIEELERLQPLLREARNEDKAQIEAAAQAQAQAAAEDATASRMAELEAVTNFDQPALPMHPREHAWGQVLRQMHMCTTDMRINAALDGERCPEGHGLGKAVFVNHYLAAYIGARNVCRGHPFC